MISFDEAIALVVDAARPLGFETVKIAEGHRRVLAAPVIAAVDSPPAEVSAMDGYAVREADLPGPVRMIGESFPGAGFNGVIGAGQCVRIFTGAPVPAGADRVIVQEIVRRDGDEVSLQGNYSSSRHIRAHGSDFRVGNRLLDAGRLLDARAMVAVAGADAASVEVWRRPRVAVLGTGDELAEPGRARDLPGLIPESVSAGVGALAVEQGAELVSSERLPDRIEVIRAAAERALGTADLVVLTGGASVGDKDFARPVLASLGLEPIFTKVAIRPGKPIWLGRVGETLVIGLPGNPTSAMVTARLFMVPLLAGLGGRVPKLAWRTAPLATGIGPTADRETFARARWTGEAVEPLGNQESGAQHALVEADLLIRRRPGSPPAQAGELVEVIDF